ncbi:MAG: hypothetical protein QXO98_04915 [Sulfolobales archaeon]
MFEEKVKLVEEALIRVEVPGFDIDVISSGVVRSFRLSKGGDKVIVYVDFLSSDPHCLFCKFINHTLWSTISDSIKKALKEVGLKEVTIVDIRTNKEL